MTLKRIATRPIAGMKPGTSALRKKVAGFAQGRYLANFVRSAFNAGNGGPAPGKIADAIHAGILPNRNIYITFLDNWSYPRWCASLTRWIYEESFYREA